MRPSLRIEAGREHPDALTFEDRKDLTAKIEDDMTHVTVRMVGGEAVVALHDRDRGLSRGIEINARFGCRDWRFGAPASALMGFGDQRRGGFVERLHRAARLAAVGEVLLLRQLRPAK